MFIVPLKNQHTGLDWGTQSKQSWLIMPWPSSSTPPLCGESEGGQNQHYGLVSTVQSTSFIGFESRPEYAESTPCHFNPVTAHAKVTCDDLYDVNSISTETPWIVKLGSGQFSSASISYEVCRWPSEDPAESSVS